MRAIGLGLKLRMKLGSDVEIYDPWVSTDEVKIDFGIDVSNDFPKGKYDAIVFAVSHDSFKEIDRLELEKILTRSRAVFSNIRTKDSFKFLKIEREVRD